MVDFHFHTNRVRQTEILIAVDHLWSYLTHNRKNTCRKYFFFSLLRRIYTVVNKYTISYTCLYGSALDRFVMTDKCGCCTSQKQRNFLCMDFEVSVANTFYFVQNRKRIKPTVSTLYFPPAREIVIQQKPIRVRQCIVRRCIVRFFYRPWVIVAAKGRQRV